MKIILIIVITILIGLIYRNIFFFTPLFGGDYISLTIDNINFFRDYPFQAWSNYSSLGSSNIGFINGNLFAYLVGLAGLLVNDNSIILERLFYWIPFVFLSCYSIYKLYKYAYPSGSFGAVSAFIYVCNPYILMIIGGGQIVGIGLAYAIAPLAIMRFLILWNDIGSIHIKNFYNAVMFGLMMTIIIMFDIRIAYITSIIIFFIVLLDQLSSIRIKSLISKRTLLKIFYALVIPAIIVFAISAYWVLPLIIFKVSPLRALGDNYFSIEAIRFFSFAKLENSISLLHPNWPENVFGKTYFMKPEFIVLPIIVFSTLTYLKKIKNVSNLNKYILIFVILGLTGAFLSKGVNEPFGSFYIWLFQNMPGFEMFRDPTKWYLMVSISYSIIIPTSLELILDRFKKSSIVSRK